MRLLSSAAVLAVSAAVGLCSAQASSQERNDPHDPPRAAAHAKAHGSRYALDAHGRCHAANGKFAKAALCKKGITKHFPVRRPLCKLDPETHHCVGPPHDEPSNP